MEYTLTPLAATLPLLHAAKHHASTLNGVFLGVPSAPSSSSSSSSSSVQITHAVPLLHHYTSLSPMMEIGLEMVYAHAAERGLDVVGYYQANEVGGGLGRVGERVVDKLRARHSGAFGLVINNERILSEQPYDVPPGVKLTLPGLHLRALLDADVHLGLGDFDDHLEDVRVDWIGNPAVTAAVEGRQ
ncbi:hypothetical protein Q5752_003072 [Cryptotrichosporon argae]